MEQHDLELLSPGPDAGILILLEPPSPIPSHHPPQHPALWDE